jgi:hypothetical protein
VNNLRIEAESSKVATVYRGNVLLTRVPVDRLGILWTISLAGCGLNEAEVHWLNAESARVMRDYRPRRRGLVARVMDWFSSPQPTRVATDVPPSVGPAARWRNCDWSRKP